MRTLPVAVSVNRFFALDLVLILGISHSISPSAPFVEEAPVYTGPLDPLQAHKGIARFYLKAYICDFSGELPPLSSADPLTAASAQLSQHHRGHS